MTYPQIIAGMSGPVAAPARAWLRLLTMMVLASLVSACATGPYAPSSRGGDVTTRSMPLPRSEAPTVRSESAAPKSAPTTPRKEDSSRTIAKGVRTERSRPSPAAQAMIDKAQDARASGQLAQATSMLERAQRMSPQAAEVYYELAAVKMAEKAYAQAEQLCQKALSLAGDDSRFRSRVWQRIAEIREARGDKRGAETARRNVQGRG